jgi:Peptidase C39 family
MVSWKIVGGAAGLLALGLCVYTFTRPIKSTEKITMVPIRSASIGEIRSTPEYKNAIVAFSSGKKADAKRNLFLLSQKPGLSELDKQFLDRQITLCDSEKLPDAPQMKLATVPLAVVDCGPQALKIAADMLGVSADIANLRKSAGTSRDGTSLDGLEKAAKSIGLRSESLQVDKDALAQISTPAVAWLDGNHFVTLLGVSRDSATLHDPNEGKEKEMPLLELLSRSGGIVLTLKKG